MLATARRDESSEEKTSRAGFNQIQLDEQVSLLWIYAVDLRSLVTPVLGRKALCSSLVAMRLTSTGLPGKGYAGTKR